MYLGVLRDNGIECTVEKFPEGSLARYRLLKQGTDFDAVFLHKKRLNVLDALCLRRYARKVIYDFDDAVMYLDRDPDRVSIKRRLDFRRTVRAADLVLAANTYLARHARPYNANIEIVPTGLDLQDYNLDGIDKTDDRMVRLVWIGSKSTLGYLHAKKDVFEQIGANTNNVVLRIICDEFFDLRNMEVQKCRWSIETQASDLMTSDIGLAPLPDDAFTRGKGGFKILQYAAAGLPVVASPVGVNGQYVRDGVDGFHADRDSDWIERISRLANDAQLRKQMGQSARQAVRGFDLRVIGKQLCDLLNRYA